MLCVIANIDATWMLPVYYPPVSCLCWLVFFVCFYSYLFISVDIFFSFCSECPWSRKVTNSRGSFISLLKWHSNILLLHWQPSTIIRYISLWYCQLCGWRVTLAHRRWWTRWRAYRNMARVNKPISNWHCWTNCLTTLMRKHSSVNWWV